MEAQNHTYTMTFPKNHIKNRKLLNIYLFIILLHNIQKLIDCLKWFWSNITTYNKESQSATSKLEQCTNRNWSNKLKVNIGMAKYKTQLPQQYLVQIRKHTHMYVQHKPCNTTQSSTKTDSQVQRPVRIYSKHHNIWQNPCCNLCDIIIGTCGTQGH